MKAINIVNQCNEENYESLIKPVLKKAYKRMKVSKKKTINIILITSGAMRELNSTYRDTDKVTDVLTFPSDVDDELGDVFISLHTAMEQAKAYGHTFRRELAFLVVHGFLHAIGYDHDTKEKEHVMFSLQEQILNELKLSR